MTDKELLELAAKAAGIESYTRIVGNGRTTAERKFCGSEWNPLTDDGDALRLAVKLDLIPHYFRHMPTVGTRDSIEDTRRAIVRAAAEIGKETP